MERKPSRWDKAKRVLPILALVVSILLIVTPFTLAVYHRIELGSWPPWTGFGDYVTPAVGGNQEFHRGKTLWDWMQLFIIPIVLAFGAYFLNRSERRNESKIAADRQRDATLQNYLDKMADLLLKEKLFEKIDIENDSTVKIAQVRTVTTLRILDTNRQNILLQFLRDANLADFILKDASLSGIDLSHVNLWLLNLSGANLSKANLCGAILFMTNLDNAYLVEANLREADMFDTRLNGANLLNADLTGAKVAEGQLAAAWLGSAIMPDGTKYDGRFDRKEEEQEGQ